MPAVWSCRPFVSESLQAQKRSWYAMDWYLACHAIFCLKVDVLHRSGLFWRKLRSEMVQRLLVGKVSAVKHMCSLLCAKQRTFAGGTNLSYFMEMTRWTRVTLLQLSWSKKSEQKASLFSSLGKAGAFAGALLSILKVTH